VSDNATGDLGLGGGIAADDASTIVLTGSTVSGNTSGDGGGVFAWRGTVSLRNSTVSGNTATGQGGGIATYQVDGLDLIQSTITANTASVGAGIRLYSRAALGTSVTAFGSLLAGNTGSPDIEHANGADDAITGDHNLIGTISAHIAYPSDTLSCDPHLQPLAGNGGPTATHALAADSCARDTGGFMAWSNYDQRGEGHPRFVGDAVDIGAYEYAAADTDRLFADGFD